MEIDGELWRRFTQSKEYADACKQAKQKSNVPTHARTVWEEYKKTPGYKKITAELAEKGETSCIELDDGITSVNTAYLQDLFAWATQSASSKSVQETSPNTPSDDDIPDLTVEQMKRVWNEYMKTPGFKKITTGLVQNNTIPYKETPDNIFFDPAYKHDLAAFTMSHMYLLEAPPKPEPQIAPEPVISFADSWHSVRRTLPRLTRPPITPPSSPELGTAKGIKAKLCKDLDTIDKKLEMCSLFCDVD